MGKGGLRRPSILLAHRDAAWVDQAKQRLQELGYLVIDCLEPEWAPDLISGSRPFDLAAVSSELDPAVQAEMIRGLKTKPRPPKLVFLLDELDNSGTMPAGRATIPTFRITESLDAFAKLVSHHVGPVSAPA